MINSVTAEEKSNLVITCFKHFHETGVIIKILTFDRAAINVTISIYLECNLVDYNTSFNHPLTQSQIHVFLNIAHVLKLVRNTLGDLGVIYIDEGYKQFSGIILNTWLTYRKEGDFI